VFVNNDKNLRLMNLLPARERRKDPLKPDINCHIYLENSEKYETLSKYTFCLETKTSLKFKDIETNPLQIQHYLIKMSIINKYIELRKKDPSGNKMIFDDFEAIYGAVADFEKMNLYKL